MSHALSDSPAPRQRSLRPQFSRAQPLDADRGARARTNILGPSNAVAAGTAEPRKNFGEVKIESSVPGRVEAAATSTEGGLLVLHDSYYPGWMAEVDGKSTPIRRADLLFRAIEVPPGTHRVTFRFAPFALANLHAALNAALGRGSIGPAAGSR
jgi:Bacterial membrane protein YfhO